MKTDTSRKKPVKVKPGESIEMPFPISVENKTPDTIQVIGSPSLAVIFDPHRALVGLNEARALPRKNRLAAAENQRKKTDKRVKRAWNYYAKRTPPVPELNRAARIAQKISMSESEVRKSINRQRLRSR